MHTLNRFLTVLVLCAVLVPLGTSALLTLEERHRAAESLESALDQAGRSYRFRTGVQVLRERGKKTLAEEEPRLRELAQQKGETRRRITALKRLLRDFEKVYGMDPAASEKIARTLRLEKRDFLKDLRHTYVEDLLATWRAGSPLRLRLIAGDLETRTTAFLASRAVEHARMRFLRAMTAARSASEELAALTGEYKDLQGDYVASFQSVEKARDLVARTEAEMEAIKAIMADVHAQVLSLQGELARIDAKLKRKAERALIEKGLLDPEDVESGRMLSSAPSFLWPVHGPISAGFLNEGYKKHFGVPHYGADIVVPQGSPVYSAADGIVFLVRDGGETGYTYVLVGHRAGFATLYGHLSSVSVISGQEISAGELVGMSGAQPGTRGAGPMTTGPHLHFEVIQNGTNVDPLGVLP